MDGRGEGSGAVYPRPARLDHKAGAVGYFAVRFGDIVHHDIVTLPASGRDSAADIAALGGVVLDEGVCRQEAVEVFRFLLALAAAADGGADKLGGHHGRFRLAVIDS